MKYLLLLTFSLLSFSDARTDNFHNVKPESEEEIKVKEISTPLEELSQNLDSMASKMDSLAIKINSQKTKE